MVGHYGQHCVISEDAKIGERTRIGNFVLIRDRTVVGIGCVLGSFVDIEGGCGLGISCRCKAAAM